MFAFGSASVGERSDHALAEFNTDLMTMYFRAEINMLFTAKGARGVRFYKQDKKFYDRQTHDRVKFSTKLAAEKAKLEPPFDTTLYPKESTDGALV